MQGQTSHQNLATGLELVGRQFLKGNQWVGKFATQQNAHQYPVQEDDDQYFYTKFGKAVSDSLKKFQQEKKILCGLCLTPKPISEFSRMCKCDHEYCYSCLNSYAISRIQDIKPVVCPNHICGQLMTIKSQIFKFMPNKAKSQYLLKKQDFLIGKNNETIQKIKSNKICQRCLQQEHPGQCLYLLNAQSIQKSFKHRQCASCHVQISLPDGRQFLNCNRCHKITCFLCGSHVDQEKKSKHVCFSQIAVLLKKEEKEQQPDDNCQNSPCFLLFFDCKHDCRLACCLWNICSIPIRLMMSVFVFIAYLLFGSILLGITTTAWIVVCILAGIFAIPMELICSKKTPGCLSLLMLIFYPITILVSIFIALIDSSKTPKRIYSKFFFNCCSSFQDLWIYLSPNKFL